jgi:anti-anti-sigma factor
VQNPSSAAEGRFAVRGDRRNGIDRLSLVGELDHGNVLMLEGELNAFARAEGALIVDLRGLTSIDRWGLHALERAAKRAGQGALRLAIVNGRGRVLRAFKAAGFGHLLSGSDVSELLDPSNGAWSPVSLPPLLGQRGSERIVEEQR